MEGWKDGRMEGWKDGRMEGWKDQPPCDHRALRASFFPAAHEGVKILTLPLLSGLILETLGLARRSQRGGAFDRAIRLKLVEVSRRGPQPNRPRRRGRSAVRSTALGLVRPLRSACFVSRRSLRKDAAQQGAAPFHVTSPRSVN